MVHLTSPFAVSSTSAFDLGIANYALPVPNDLILVGATFSGQALLNNLGCALVLTNRLDFRLGL